MGRTKNIGWVRKIYGKVGRGKWGGGNDIAELEGKGGEDGRTMR